MRRTDCSHVLPWVRCGFHETFSNWIPCEYDQRNVLLCVGQRFQYILGENTRGSIDNIRTLCDKLFGKFATGIEIASGVTDIDYRCLTVGVTILAQALQ